MALSLELLSLALMETHLGRAGGSEDAAEMEQEQEDQPHAVGSWSSASDLTSKRGLAGSGLKSFRSKLFAAVAPTFSYPGRPRQVPRGTLTCKKLS